MAKHKIIIEIEENEHSGNIEFQSDIDASPKILLRAVIELLDTFQDIPGSKDNPIVHAIFMAGVHKCRTILNAFYPCETRTTETNFHDQPEATQ